MHSFALLFVIIALCAATNIVSPSLERNHKKRQIYREHVSPHTGGRIPDTAFQTDRLFLNRLQKDGIAIPDGVLLETRTPQVYPFLSKPMREVYRVALSPDTGLMESSSSSSTSFSHRGARHGHHKNGGITPSVETTYLYPQIHGQPMLKPGREPKYPIHREIQLPNSQLFQKKTQTKYRASNPNPLDGSINDQKYPKIQSFQNLNIANGPSSRPRYFAKYDSEELLDDFDNFFNSLYLHGSGRFSGDKLNRYSTRYARH